MKWEMLGGNIGVWTTDSFKIMTDTLLLGRFAMPKKGESCADIGTGCGAIPMLWCAEGQPGRVIGIEIVPEAAELAEKSADKSGLSGKVEIVRGDAADHRGLLPRQQLDMIACNPPYYVPGAGASAEGARQVAREGVVFGLADLAAAAKWSLKYGGRLCLCLPVERMAEAMELFRGAGLEPKRMKLVQSAAGKAPYLFLLECRYGGKPGLTVEENLILTGGRLYGE